MQLDLANTSASAANMDCYAFREANELDFLNIAAFFKKYDFGLKEEQWLRWKYLENPAGRGRIFIMEDSQKEIKGAVGFIPRTIFSADSGSLRVMESLDLFIAPEIRGKKLFPKMQRFAMNLIEGPSIAFPAARSRKVMVDFGWRVFAPLESWYFPIALGGSPTKSVIRYLSLLLKILCTIYASFWLTRNSHTVKMRPVVKFEHDFTKTRNKNQLGMARPPSILNWRFINNPIQKYLAFEFYENDNILGYCVLKMQVNSVKIIDFFASRCRRSCLRKLVDYCRVMGISKLIFWGVGLRLWRFGFIRLFSVTSLVQYNLPKKPWVLTLGDSDW